VGLQFAIANQSVWGNQLVGLGKPILPGAPIHAALVQLQETLRSDRRGWEWKSLTRHHFAHVVQRRDGALNKTRTVLVQIRPWALVAVRKHPRVAQCRGVPLKPERLQVHCNSRQRTVLLGHLTRKAWEAHSCHADQFSEVDSQ
jgi:hypothetical protein